VNFCLIASFFEFNRKTASEKKAVYVFSFYDVIFLIISSVNMLGNILCTCSYQFYDATCLIVFPVKMLEKISI
jgi:hypothetical protein